MSNLYRFLIILSTIILLPQSNLNARVINSPQNNEQSSQYLDIPKLIENNLKIHSLPSVKRDRIENQILDFLGIEIRKSKINFLYAEKKAAIESKNIRNLYKSLMDSQIANFDYSSNLLNQSSNFID